MHMLLKISHKKITETYDNNNIHNESTVYDYSEPVLQLKLNGDIIKEYSSYRDAQEFFSYF